MRKLVELKNLSREQWLKHRKKGIGGSDISSICGLNPYRSALECYLDKTDRKIPEASENIAAEIGLELEPYLSKKFVNWIYKNENIEIELKEMPEMLQHETIDYFLVNLDRWFLHPKYGKCPVELKTTTEFKRDAWVGDEIPDSYYTQVQWQLYITNWNYAYIAFLIGNRSFDVKLIKRNEDVIKKLSVMGKRFWKNFVLKEIPPAPDGTDSAENSIKILFPEEELGTKKTFNPKVEKEIGKICSEIENFSGKKSEIDKELKRLKQIVKIEIGDSELAYADGRKITFRTIGISERIVKSYSFRKLLIGKKKEE